MMKALILALAFIAVVHAAIPNDGSRTGTCTSPSATELAAPSFQKAGSSLTSSNLILRFPSDEHFASVAFVFVSGSDKNNNVAEGSRYCDYTAAQGVTGPFPSWSQEETAGTECAGVTFVANFNQPRSALGHCFDYDNTTDPNYTYYTAIVKVTTTQNRPAIRTIDITRTTTTALQLRFRFQRFITVSSTNATVVGSANVKSDIILQEFDTATEYTKIWIYTSVQQPYNLSLVGADNGTPLSSTSYDFVAQSNGANILPYFANNNAFNNGAGANDGVCDAAGVNNDGNPAPPLGPNGWAQPNACVQIWQFQIKATDSAICKFDVTVTLNFKIYTTADYLGGSGLSPNEQNYQVVYALATNDYCTKIVDEISLSGNLIPYGAYPADATNAGTPLYNYLFGQTVYFVAHITPSAGPSITAVNFVSGTVQSVSTVNSFQISFDQVGAPLPANNIYGFGVYTYAGTYNEYAGFKFLVNEQTVLLDNFDLAQTVSVTATFRVDYQNLGSSSQEIELSSAPKMRLAANGRQALDLKTDVSITRPASTASSSSSLVAMVAGIAAGCVALTAFVALFLYRRATNKFVEQASAPVDPKELEALEKRLEGTAV